LCYTAVDFEQEISMFYGKGTSGVEAVSGGEESSAGSESSTGTERGIIKGLKALNFEQDKTTAFEDEESDTMSEYSVATSVPDMDERLGYTALDLAPGIPPVFGEEDDETERGFGLGDDSLDRFRLPRRRMTEVTGISTVTETTQTMSLTVVSGHASVYDLLAEGS
jgi:hypothetical protein